MESGNPEEEEIERTIDSITDFCLYLNTMKSFPDLKLHLEIHELAGSANEPRIHVLRQRLPDVRCAAAVIAHCTNRDTAHDAGSRGTRVALKRQDVVTSEHCERVTP